ncbi:tRNA-uridine aminocarboxypropyltransferase [Pseudoalteromonas sp. J010]|uniref:tRNA-uridine aminocarboxypropyltransferase n=1 Tax=Pseudoalteromonas sp. J010 TaxID=998465 RepID=UPI0023B88806|nr:tRNA-uridine aminocarboxypropyltransferase [Pseudoalteromonas sp. J010]
MPSFLKLFVFMKRNTCPVCAFPLQTCVCSYIGELIDNSIEVVVMQHPSEAKVAKNTAKLLALQLRNIQIVVGENERDFDNLKAYCEQKHVALLYPNDQAQSLVQQRDEYANLHAVIVLDGTWKKATKLYQLNPWLHHLPSLKFDTVDASEYTIRKSKHKYSLSTLEATAHFLNLIDSCNVDALYTLQKGMVEEQMKLMPVDVKARY